MLILEEALIVGLYSYCVFSVVSYVIDMFDMFDKFGKFVCLRNNKQIRKTKTIVYFLTGFFKHFLAGIFNIHNRYCKYKYDVSIQHNITRLFLESLMEGVLFMILMSMIDNAFLVGFILHFSFELSGLHRLFCGII